MHILLKRRFARILAVMAFTAACPGCWQAPPPPRDADALNPPAITMARVATIQSLLRDARGKVVVLNLWATWCVPCAAEMPEFVRFYREQQPGGAVFISISTDDPAAAQTQVREFQKAKDIPFPVYVLEERDPDALGKVLQTEFSGALPVTLLYGRDGTLKKAWSTAITLEELNQAVKPLL